MKKCPQCNRNKKLHLFSKNQGWCKACSKKYRQQHTANLKEHDFHKYKATQFRSNRIRKAKQMGVDIKEVPSRLDIIDWLNKKYPYTCYFTGEALDRKFGVDHMIPIARGGSFGLSNLCITSPFLNGAKGAMTVDEFKQLLKLISKWEDKGKGILARLQVSNSMFGKPRKG